MQRTYTVAREGFLMNSYKRKGEKVVLHERQATYLIHAGQLENPNAKPTVHDVVTAAFAAHAASAPAPAAAPSTPAKS